MQIWLFMKEKSKGALLPKEYNILLSPDFVIKRWLFYLGFIFMEMWSQDIFKA